jgi:hypothetical protein
MSMRENRFDGGRHNDVRCKRLLRIGVVSLARRIGALIQIMSWQAPRTPSINAAFD